MSLLLSQLPTTNHQPPTDAVESSRVTPSSVVLSGTYGSYYSTVIHRNHRLSLSNQPTNQPTNNAIGCFVRCMRTNHSNSLQPPQSVVKHTNEHNALRECGALYASMAWLRLRCCTVRTYNTVACCRSKPRKKNYWQRRLD